MHVKIATKEDLDQLQKQSDLGLRCLHRPFWQETSVLNWKYLPYMYLHRPLPLAHTTADREVLDLNPGVPLFFFI